MRAEGAIWVAGHRGMVGSALVRRLEADGERVVVAGNAAPIAAAKPRSKKPVAPQPNLFDG